MRTVKKEAASDGGTNLCTDSSISGDNPVCKHEETSATMAERALLGALLVDFNVARPALDVVAGDRFHDAKNRQLFAAITKCASTGAVDIVLVEEQLRRDGNLDAANGEEYLVRLAEEVPSAGNATYYAMLVHDAAMERAVRMAVERLQHRLQQPGAGSAEALAAFERDVASVQAGKAQGRERFHLWTTEEILALEDLDWIIQDFIPDDSAVEIYGAFGTKKSFIVEDQAFHVATGTDWHGHKVREPQLVFYILGEGKRGFKNRYRAWMDWHGMSTDDMKLFRLITDPVQLVDADDVELLMRRIEKQIGATRPGEVGMIVCDTLAQCLRGQKENAPEVMSAAVGGLRDLREKFGGSSVLVHHCGWDKSHGRGHTSLPGDVDVILNVASAPGTLVADIKVEKSRDHVAGATYRVNLEEHERSLVVTGVRQLSADEAAATADGTAHLKPTIDALKRLGGRATSGEWQHASGKSRTTYNEHRRKIMNLGLVRAEGGLYVLTSTGV